MVCNSRISGDGGLSWSGWESAFSGNNPVSPFTHPIPSEYATSQFRLQFYLAGFGISGRNAYIDNVTISRLESGTWDAGGDWQVISGRFRAGTDANRFLTIMENIDLSTYADKRYASVGTSTKTAIFQAVMVYSSRYPR
jgi:hypothetical protein